MSWATPGSDCSHARHRGGGELLAMKTEHQGICTKGLPDGAEQSLRLDIADKLAAHFGIISRRKDG
jgi:hypothetical protein